MTERSSVLEVTGLGKRFGGFVALENIDITVETGERLGLIGPNGSGKSTLLKILSRIAEPSSGWAEVTGRVGSLLEVGTGFHPELTGRENVYLNGSIIGMSRAEVRRRFDEIVAFAEIDRFLDTPVKRYSSGMSVRLAFAVAAHLEPEVLLVDEVLAVGDAAFQRKSLGKMTEVASEGLDFALPRSRSTVSCLANWSAIWSSANAKSSSSWNSWPTSASASAWFGVTRNGSPSRPVRSGSPSQSSAEGIWRRARSWIASA